VVVLLVVLDFQVKEIMAALLDFLEVMDQEAVVHQEAEEMALVLVAKLAALAALEQQIQLLELL
jgi:hypothetical protein